MSAKAIALFLDQQKQIAFQTYKEEMDLLVGRSHPLKIGDVVECNGFSHRGKKFRIKYLSYKIDHYGIRDEGKRFYWTATGYIIKKDGTESASQLGYWKEEVKD